MEKMHRSTEEAAPAEREQRVLALVGERRSVRIEELEAYIAEVRNSIAVGRLRLIMVQRGWGIEFCVAKGGSPWDREALHQAD